MKVYSINDKQKPKDGETVMVYHDRRGGHWVRAEWNPYQSKTESYATDGFYFDGQYKDEHGYITHWMRFPSKYPDYENR